MSAKPHLDAAQIEAIARAVADPRRFEILQKIARAEGCPCSSLRESQPISPATLSHHARELEDAGLIQAQREGRTVTFHFRRDVWDAYLQKLAKL